MSAATRVDLHVVDLDGAPGDASWLSPEEALRASRFRSARDAHRFRAGRIAVRRVLGAATGVDPARLRFQTGEFGKPSIVGASGVHFSFSNTRGVGVVAVADVPVGVDAEETVPDVDLDEVAATFFAPAEVAAVRHGDPSARRAAFLRCWTRKEAVVKADGRGLRIGLDRFVVAVAEDEPPAVLHSEDPVLGPAASWALVDLSWCVPDGVVAALAARTAALAPVLRRPQGTRPMPYLARRRDEGALR